jgi:hypothetical protein
MANNFMQGYYELKHPEKYIGDPAKIRFMSSWEFETHKFFDNNARVVKWSSEPFGIPYLKPTTGKVHKYFVDYYCEYIDANGEIHKELIEVKPMSQVKAPTNRGNMKNRAYAEVMHHINVAKWNAAIAYCKEHNMTFRIITENSIFK